MLVLTAPPYLSEQEQVVQRVKNDALWRYGLSRQLPLPRH